jgi:DNA polymerase-3 subunit gamma/tau
MSIGNYQVTARRFRPQKFADVVEQRAIVTTIQNGLKTGKMAHAYLLAGPRGTGKTTLARLIAKALNCENRDENFEPCGSCRSCKEIASGASLDVLEIDGASHRGIDDVRSITEGVGYSVGKGHCKVYIIDEVHMLTKEAFNALLKTLEEPPAGAKFLFATTEAHKVPATILSRCQRLLLKRIPTELIVKKLQEIAKEVDVKITDGALFKVAEMAEGSLRDAESLFDQLISFGSENVDEQAVQNAFGLISSEMLFTLDKAGKEGHLNSAFDIVEKLHQEGKHLLHFLDSLIHHFRILSKLKMGVPAESLVWTKEEQQKYQESKEYYTKQQVLDNLAYLVEKHDAFRESHHPRVALEAILLHILRSHTRIPIEMLIDKVNAMQGAPTPPPKAPPPAPKPKAEPKRESVDITPKPQELDKKIESKELLSLTPREENLIQFAAVELQGSLKKGYR